MKFEDIFVCENRAGRPKRLRLIREPFGYLKPVVLLNLSALGCPEELLGVSPISKLGINLLVVAAAELLHNQERVSRTKNVEKHCLVIY